MKHPALVPNGYGMLTFPQRSPESFKACELTTAAFVVHSKIKGNSTLCQLTVTRVPRAFWTLHIFVMNQVTWCSSCWLCVLLEQRLTIYFIEILISFLWIMKKDVKTLIFFSYKTFFF